MCKFALFYLKINNLAHHIYKKFNVDVHNPSAYDSLYPLILIKFLKKEEHL